MILLLGPKAPNRVQASRAGFNVAIGFNRGEQMAVAGWQSNRASGSVLGVQAVNRENIFLIWWQYIKAFGKNLITRLDYWGGFY